MCDYGPFNNDTKVSNDIKRLIKNFNIKTFIESGTYKGNTTLFMANLVELVFSIEVNTDFYNNVKKINTYNNVKLFNGNSVDVLDDLLKYNLGKDNILFYLDAHWNNYWPLRDELFVISKYKKNNCIIVIDDFFVPNRAYIKYDVYKGIINNLEYIKDMLDLVYDDGYTYYYNDKVDNMDINSGKIYIYPKKWTSNDILYYTENNINYSTIA